MMRRFFMTLALVMMLVSLIACGQEQQTIFRDISWDNTYNEIVEIEKGQFSKVRLDDGLIVASNVLVFDMYVDSVIYRFEDSLLNMIEVRFREIKDKDKLKTEFEYLVEEISELYGKPVNITAQINSAEWSLDGYIITLEKWHGTEHNLRFIKQ